MVLDGERCGRLASHGLSANLMIARQENVQGSRSHFPILVKLFALWWQMLVQTSDRMITVRSQIAKACAHGRRPDCDCLFRSYAVDIYALRSFSFLFNLLLADTDTAPFNFSRTTAADPGLMLQTPSPLLLTNKRSFSQNECLWSLQTNFYRMFGEIWFCLLLATSATAANLLNSTGEASGCYFLRGLQVSIRDCNGLQES